MNHRQFHLGTFVGTFVGLMLSAAPKVAADRPRPKDAGIITVTLDGRVLFRATVVPLDRLAETIERSGVPHGEIVVRMDRRVSYRSIIRVLDALPQSHSSLLDA